MHFRPFQSKTELLHAVCGTLFEELRGDPRFYCQNKSSAFALCLDGKDAELYFCSLEVMGKGTRYVYPISETPSESKSQVIRERYIGMVLCQRLGLAEAALDFRNSAWYLEDHTPQEEIAEDLEVADYLHQGTSP